VIRSIDHIVILVRELETAIADYTALGFTVAPGGEHTGGATHNALVAFADGSYLELIAFRREAPDHHWWPKVAAGPGLIDYALLPDDIAADVAAARERGLDIAGPFDGGRVRPDGVRIAWQTARPLAPELPFLCADVTPRDLRVPSGRFTQHPCGAIGIASLSVAVADLAASAARYRALLGVDAADAEASFRLNEAQILLVNGGAGDAAEQLASRGEGPMALALRVPGLSTPRTLDREQAHGARLTLVPA
jgi:catechol 2,3-dioxygenase-like lactoylglutathione lyase family enzyme